METKPATAHAKTASILAIATTAPPHVLQQSSFADYYFRVTGSDHMQGLKQKFEKLCERSGIETRHTALTEEYLKANPSISEHGGKSLDARQKLACSEIVRLAKEAAEKAVAAWKQPLSRVTHLLFFTGSSVDMPGADVALTNQMGLNASVKRMMFYMQGCSSGGGLLRVAKDVAESNPGARLLVLCGDVATVATFRGPSDADDIATLIGQSFSGDGMAALIVGTNPTKAEAPLFEINSCLSHLVPHTEHAADGHVTEAGFTFYNARDFPDLLSSAVSQQLPSFTELKTCLQERALTPDVLNSSLFSVSHAGGRRTLDLLEQKLGLLPDKLKRTREVFAQHGSMGSCTVLFALERLLLHDLQSKHADAPSWGVVVGYGIGISIDLVILRRLV